MEMRLPSQRHVSKQLPFQFPVLGTSPWARLDRVIAGNTSPTLDTWLQYFSMVTNIPIGGASRLAPVGLTMKIGDSFYGILTTGGNQA